LATAVAVPQVILQSDPRQVATPQSPVLLPTQPTVQVEPPRHWVETPQSPVNVDDVDVPQSTLQSEELHVVTPHCASPPGQSTVQLAPV
jgi:hypothetical protein